MALTNDYYLLGKAHANSIGIALIPLPVRSPELNPMESLWRNAKDARCANRQYEGIGQEVAEVVEYLETMSNDEAIEISGILSGQFWVTSIM